MSWYSTGFDGIEREEQRIESSRGPQRFWLTAGSSKEFVFIDDDPFTMYEHNPRIGGTYTPITCLQGATEDAACCQKLGPNSRYWVGFLTIVDCSKWTDKRGTDHQYEMRMLPCKLNSLKMLKRKKDSAGSLVAGLYNATRDSDKMAAIGNEWEKKRDVDLSKLFDLACFRGEKLPKLWERAESDASIMERVKNMFDIEPVKGRLPREIPHFNYVEILKPMAPKDLRLLLGGVEADSGQGGSGGSEDIDSDDVPF